jgi:hypothetical protein
VVEEVVKAPATYIALLVIAIGLACWWQRDKLSGLSNALNGLGKAATDSFGFEAINRGVVNGVQSSAESLRGTQTGLLNWNIAAILIGLIVVLVILVMGA